MPKDTFFNLPDKKRNNILEIAINEFYNYGYEKSSISRIVKDCGIAKGSFYQYFEDKDDLFAFILRTSGEKKLSYLNSLKSDFSDMNFFELLKIIYTGSVDFLRDNNKLAEITDKFLRNSPSDLKEKLLGEGIKKSNDFLENLLKIAIGKNEIKSDIDILFISHLLTDISISLGDFIRNKYTDVSKINKEEYLRIIDQTLDFIKSGILSS